MPVLALLDPSTILFVAGGLTFAVELVTVFLRFGLGLRSGTEGSRIGRLTRGVRIHHGYVGAALLLGGALFGPASAAGTALFFAGFALAVSDIIHHFLVLWPITGATEFHLRYPAPAVVESE
jgi:hypothetical protein